MPKIENQEAIQKLAKQISDTIRANNEEYDALNDTKLRKMVEEQLKIMKPALDSQDEVIDPPAPISRKSSGFEDDGDDLDPDEKKDLRAGARNPMEGRKKMLMSSKQLRRYHNDSVVEKIVELQELNDDLYIIGKILAHQQGVPYAKAVRETQMYANIKDRIEKDESLKKALAAGTSSYGAEWIPTGFSNQMVEQMRLNQKVEALFPAINMPTNPYTWPIQSSKASVYKIPESTTDASTKIKTTNYQTGNFSFNAIKLGARLVFSEELNEDSIINVLDFTKMEFGQAFADGRETAIINGALTATQDAVTDTTDPRKAFDALRYWSLNSAGTAKYDFSNAVVDTTKLRAMRKLALKYGVNPANNAWIVSINGYIQMLNLNEVLSADKWPQGYTARFGELATFDGSPVIVSEHLADNLNASGVYDGSVTNRTSVLYVYRPGFWVGNRSMMTLKVVQDPETDQIIVVAKTRFDFEDPLDATLAANPMVINGYNVKT